MELVQFPAETRSGAAARELDARMEARVAAVARQIMTDWRRPRRPTQQWGLWSGKEEPGAGRKSSIR